MKKIIAIIPIAIIIILLSSVKNVNADSSHYVILIDTYDGMYRANLYNCGTNATFYSYSNTQYKLDHAQGYSIGNVWHASIDAAVTYAKQYISNLPSISTNSSLYIGKSEPLIILNNVSTSVSADNVYLSFEDYENSLIPPPDPTWWDVMWDTFSDYFTGDPFEWIKTLINGVYGDDSEGTISDNVTLEAPTIAPTPTPIPYTTVVIPKTDIVTGETVYETNYYYNISGTPIITSTPPTNTPSNGNNSNGTNYTPVNGDPYSIPKLSWLSNVEIGGDDYDGIDSVTDGLSSIDDIGSEYTDGMSAVQDATGTLPVTWILLIGVAAAIPLVAGIISRFLS